MYARFRVAISTLALSPCLAVAPPPAAAQPQSFLEEHLAFRGTLGREDVRESLGRVLQPATRSEWSVIGRTGAFSILAVPGIRLRGGAGLSRVTYDVAPAYWTAVEQNAHAERWNHVRWHLLLGLELEDVLGIGVDPYGEYRRVKGRLRSQTELTWPVTADPPRERPYEDWGVQGDEWVLGLKSDLPLVGFQIDVLYRWGSVEPRRAGSFDLTKYSLGVYAASRAVGWQIGIFWTP